MSGGGGDATPLHSAATGGEFLLSLLQRSNNQSQSLTSPAQSQFPLSNPITPPSSSLQEQLQQQQSQYQQQQLQRQQETKPLVLDPAVAAVGPSITLAPPLWQSNARDVLSPPWPHNNAPSGLFGLPQNLPGPSSGNQLQGQLSEDLQRLGFSSADIRGNSTIHNLLQKKQQLEQKLQFGSFLSDVPASSGILNANSKFKLSASKEQDDGLRIRNLNGFERNRHMDPQLISNSRTSDLQEKDQRHSGGLERQHHGGNFKSQEVRMPPPGFSNKSSREVNWEFNIRNREKNHNLNMKRGNQGEVSKRNAFVSSTDSSVKNADGLRDFGLTRQLVPPAVHSVSASDMEESLLNLDPAIIEDIKVEGHEFDEIGEELVDSLLQVGDLDDRNNMKQNRYSREKESRMDSRGQHILSQRMRMLKRQMECRRDIDRLNAHFVSIYESLIPPEEVKAKQKQLLTLLERLVNKEWPQARLYLYGSCANSFGVLKSDIDVCLAIGDADINKAEMLLKLADILQSDNLQNVQALTRARVPIVKLMDPVTGISCDICINNVLAVVNTKLLRDYSLIDVRLRQLVFIVKHWAKSRAVNETYQGTLSSYAYVLMCIHFLQQRRPAILPCLQEMEATYSVTVDDIQCSYFDKVENLNGYGSRNKETIAQLVWGFFNYWAYCHDYTNDVISVRRGRIIRKQEKDWTRRIGNDRHLICIEDPFEVSHDLGRVVDKHSIKVLREEFERAANVMQYDPNPCVTLFEAYVPRRVMYSEHNI